MLYRYYVPSQSVAVALHLTDRRRLSSVHSLLPIIFDLRSGTVLVLVIIGSRVLLPLSQLSLGDLRHRRGCARDRDRLFLNRSLLLLLLLLIPQLLSLLLLLLLRFLQCPEFPGSTIATNRFWEQLINQFVRRENRNSLRNSLFNKMKLKQLNKLNLTLCVQIFNNVI